MKAVSACQGELRTRELGPRDADDLAVIIVSRPHEVYRGELIDVLVGPRVNHRGQVLVFTNLAIKARCAGADKAVHTVGANATVLTRASRAIVGVKRAGLAVKTLCALALKASHPIGAGATV